MRPLPTIVNLALRSVIITLLLLGLPLVTRASVQAHSGAYHIELVARPALVALGRSQLLIRVTDASGKPVEGATVRSLTKMPTMSMGEREAVATPQSGQPGVYAAPAQFAMEGKYDAAIKIDGPLGSTTTTLALSTGEDTGTLTTTTPSATAPAQSQPTALVYPLLSFVPWLVGILLLAFVLYRVWRTGQRPRMRALFTRPVIGSAILLLLISGVTVYAVQKYRRPGAMTPVEAQSMQMELPAPAGTAPVELATVERGRIENSVRYSGQAVGFVEEEVTPRVTGIITAMPVYAGSRVHRGDIIARLDTSQSAPLVANERAGLNMAVQGVNVARKDYQQALAAIREAHAEVGIRRSGLEGAKADVKAAQEERANAQAQLEAAQSVVQDANAQLAATRSDQRYWQQEIEREQSLLKAGAVTQEEYQRERSQADNADAKVQQAQSRIVQVQAQVRAAEASVRKAEAMIASTQSRIDQMQAELNAHDAHVGSSDAMAASAQQKIAQAEAGVEQARAGLAAATATQGYSEIRAQTDGVVTQRVVSPGVLVNPGQVILRIARVAPIRLQANVAEADLARIRVGGQVLVSTRSGEGRPIRAQVTSVAPQIDPTTRTGVVEAILPNRDSRFLPGQYVMMDIVTAVSTNALLVPTGAIRYHTPPSGKVLSGQSVPTIWVAAPSVGQEGDYTVQEVVVRIGLSDRTKTEILSGLKEGQKIVSSGQDYLKSGDSVRPVAPMAQGGAQ